MDLIVDLPNNQELSWFTTDKKSFEWVEINQNKPGFLRAIKNLRFERAYLGIFHKKSHKTEYMAFRIIS